MGLFQGYVSLAKLDYPIVGRLTLSGFDKFLPLGPCLVSTALLPDPRDLVLETRLNGEVVQNGSARNMIWPVSE